MRMSFKNVFEIACCGNLKSINLQTLRRQTVCSIICLFPTSFYSIEMVGSTRARNECLTARFMILNWFLWVELLKSASAVTAVTADDYANVNVNPWSYKKPKPSNGPCIENLERMMVATITTTTTTTTSSISTEEPINCLGCSQQAQETCQITCQDIIDSIYEHCNGVHLPKHYYYNPPVSTVQQCTHVVFAKQRNAFILLLLILTPLLPHPPT